MSGTTNDWMTQIEDARKYGLTEIALFPTGLKEPDRYKLYQAIKKFTLVKTLPLVHLRTDMQPEEIDYLIREFNPEVFNLHTTKNWPLMYDYSKYASRIFIENGKTAPAEKELSRFGGLCIDFSHWENMVRFKDDDYDQQMKARIEKFSTGVCHISPIKKEMIPNPFESGLLQYDSHLLSEIDELDYMKKYAKYIPHISAIELENSIAEQLEVKKYLEKMFCL